MDKEYVYKYSFLKKYILVFFEKILLFHLYTGYGFGLCLDIFF